MPLIFLIIFRSKFLQDAMPGLLSVPLPSELLLSHVRLRQAVDRVQGPGCQGLGQSGRDHRKDLRPDRRTAASRRRSVWHRLSRRRRGRDEDSVGRRLLSNRLSFL